MWFRFKKVENTVAKRENAGHKQLTLDQQARPRSFIDSGVRGREVERRPCNLEVPSSIPGSGCQLWDFFIGPHIRREYCCSSQEAESREISISCKNLFLNRCKINMFKLKLSFIDSIPVSRLRPVFTNHSKECSLSFSKICKLEYDTTADWLTHTI